jgi:predicted metal-dependent hydrolase
MAADGGRATGSPVTAPGLILQGGRLKAYRPLPRPDREAAFAAFLDAYGRGDFFLAHELLEPAWMGTDDLGERALYQGLIKLAAAFVHDVRGNPTGVTRNLEGARPRLVEARDAGVDEGLDLPDLIAAIDDRLARLAASETGLEAPIVRRRNRP